MDGGSELVTGVGVWGNAAPCMSGGPVFTDCTLNSERQGLQGAPVLYEKPLVCSTEPTAVGAWRLQDTLKGLI